MYMVRCGLLLFTCTYHFLLVSFYFLCFTSRPIKIQTKIKNYEITFFVKPLFRTNLAHRAFFKTKKFSYISLLIFICRKEHAHHIVECLSKKKHKCKQNKSVYERKKYTHQKDNSTRLLTALSIFVLIVNC